MVFKIVCVIVLVLLEKGFCLWCYECAPSMPGCNDPYNWRGMGYLGTLCQEEEDKCVKLIERKGADRIVTRSCLSKLEAFRSDVPADLYEGCRPSTPDIGLASYVNNSIKELDIRRDYYDETTWCFCYLDHRCNGSSSKTSSIFLVSALIILCFRML